MSQFAGWGDGREDLVSKSRTFDILDYSMVISVSLEINMGTSVFPYDFELSRVVRSRQGLVRPEPDRTVSPGS